MKKATDVAKFREALAGAGFDNDGTIFNDKRLNSRRLKLWAGHGVTVAPHRQKVKLVSNLQDQFGDRLISVDSRTVVSMRRPTSVIVRLKL